MKKYETYAKLRQGTGYKPAPAGTNLRKSIILIALAFCTGNIMASKVDSVSVSLSASEIPFYVNLIFENKYSDTVFVSAVYRNFRYQWESTTGIMINTYRNGRLFMANLGEGGSEDLFRFADENFLLIPPNSRLKFPISVRRYFPFFRTDLKFEVSFHINYRYAIPDRGISEFVRTKTNRVEIKVSEQE